VTAARIHRLRGILKRKPGEKPFAQEWRSTRRRKKHWRMPSMPASPVLDSFALLSFLRDEPGGEKVAALLEKAAHREQPVQMTELTTRKPSTSFAAKMAMPRGGWSQANWRRCPSNFTPPTVNWPTWRLISRRGSSSAWPMLSPPPREAPECRTDHRRPGIQRGRERNQNWLAEIMATTVR